MDREISLINKIGLGCILLAICISFGFTIFSITHRSLASQVEILNEKENVKPAPSYYNDYDNVIITGNDVKDAIYRYGSDNLSIMITTLQLNDAMENGGINRTNAPDIYTNYIDFEDGSGHTGPLVYAYKSYDAMMTNNFNNNSALKSKSSKGTEVKTYLINYGMMYGGKSVRENEGVSNTKRKFEGVDYYEPRIYLDGMTNRFVCLAPSLASKAGSVMFNNRYSFSNIEGKTEYIAPQGRFHARLIVNQYDEVLGLAFIQIPND